MAACKLENSKFRNNLLNEKHGFVCFVTKKKENSGIFSRTSIQHTKGYVKGWECSGRWSI